MMAIKKAQKTMDHHRSVGTGCRTYHGYAMEKKNKALRRKYEQMMVKLKNDEIAPHQETQEETEDNNVQVEI
jgi:hypothetical protein